MYSVHVDVIVPLSFQTPANPAEELCLQSMLSMYSITIQIHKALLWMKGLGLAIHKHTPTHQPD